MPAAPGRPAAPPRRLGGCLRPCARLGPAPSWRQAPLAAARSPRRRRAAGGAALRCVAHGHGHGHSHDHACGSSHGSSSTSSSGNGGGGCCSHHSDDEQPCSVAAHAHGDDGGCCGHGGADPSSAAHRALAAFYGASGVTRAAAWLEGSAPAAAAKAGLLALAGAAAWAAPRGGGAAAAAAAAAATAGALALAGLPAAVGLSYDLTAARLDTHTLMALAAAGAAATGAPAEGALLLTLFQTSHAVERALTARARAALAALHASAPEEATLVDVGPDGAPRPGSARRVRAAAAAPGDHALVRPGEAAPLDGVVVSGRALVSLQHLTGEPAPARVRPGDAVPAGAVPADGALVLRVARRAAESTPARLAALAAAAAAARPRLRSWLDAFGGAYARAVLAAAAATLLAALAAGVPLLGGGGADIVGVGAAEGLGRLGHHLGHTRGAVYRAMAVLTVASPCALAAAPLAYVSAVAAAASRGVLLRGGAVLDALGGIAAVAVDKTGTLTTGVLALAGVAAVPGGGGAAAGGAGGAAPSGLREADALAAAAALSARARHPVADAVVAAAAGKGDAVGVEDFVLVAGAGVRGVLALLPDAGAAGGGSSSNGSSLDGASATTATRWRARFGSLDFVAPRLAGGEEAALRAVLPAGVLSVLVLEEELGAGAPPPGRPLRRSAWAFSLDDTVRPQSAAAVAALRSGAWRTAGARGGWAAGAGGAPSPAHALDVVMLTGDNAASAGRVAAALGVARVEAGLSPEGKLAAVAALRAEPRPARGWPFARRARTGVLMVGDGLNDAAALAAADVGIAVARDATSAAGLAADAVLVDAAVGVAALPALLRLAAETRAVVRQNVALAALSVAALAAPAAAGAVPLWAAVALHEGSTLLVALNSLRPLRHAAALGGGGGRARAPAGGAADEAAAAEAAALAGAAAA